MATNSFHQQTVVDKGFRDSLRRQHAVLVALVYKEMRSGFGDNRLGLIWMLLEPIIFTLMVSSLWYVIGRHKIEGVSTTAYLGTGIMPYILIKYGLDKFPASIKAGRALFNFPQVKPFDVLLARFVTNITIILTANALLFIALWWFGGVVFAVPFPLFAIGNLFIVLTMSLGLSLILGVLFTLNEDLRKAVSFLTMPLLWVSAILHAPSDMPLKAQKILAWNPVVHIIDGQRHAMLGTRLFSEYSLLYPLLTSVGLLGIGMVMYYAYRLRLIES